MTRFIVLATLMLSLPAAALAAPIATPVSSDFDADLDGWTAWGINIDNPFNPFLVDHSADLSHSATGGNPDGYARFDDVVVQTGAMLRAPAKFLGDWSGLIGTGALSFDHRIFEAGDVGPDDFSPYYAVVVSGSLTNAAGWIGPTPTGPTDWVHLEAPLDPANWQVSPLSSFEQIMANVTDLFIPFELVDNSSNQLQEHNGVDNVLLVPAPAAAYFLALGGLAALRRRRR